MQFTSLSLAGALLGLASCASSTSVSSQQESAPPASYKGFPSQALENLVLCSATFPVDDEQAMRFFGSRGLVPVRITCELRGAGQEHARILFKDEQVDPILFLADGTALRPVSKDELSEGQTPEVKSYLQSHCLKYDLLRDEPTGGLLFFRVPDADSFESDAELGEIVHLQDGNLRRLKVTGCLLSLKVTIDDRPKPLFVGVGG